MPDPERSTELLWGEAPKHGLSLAKIVRAAIGLADAEGLDAVSMRKVAERLGFTTMSLYRHVPSKADLVALMRDEVLGEGLGPPNSSVPAATDNSAIAAAQAVDATALGEEGAQAASGALGALQRDQAAEVGWRAGLTAWARDGLALYQRHPWLLDSAGSRIVPGPNAVASFERALSMAARAGLAPSEVVASVTLLGGFVESAARQVLELKRAEQQSGVSAEEWWGARNSLWERLDRYPTLSRLYSEGAYDTPVDPFEFGVQRVLDGIAALIRDDMRDESRCVVCGNPVETTGKGRPKDYCSRACQQRAYRMRAAKDVTAKDAQQ